MGFYLFGQRTQKVLEMRWCHRNISCLLGWWKKELSGHRCFRFRFRLFCFLYKNCIDLLGHTAYQNFWNQVTSEWSVSRDHVWFTIINRKLKCGICFALNTLSNRSSNLKLCWFLDYICKMMIAKIIQKLRHGQQKVYEMTAIIRMLAALIHAIVCNFS